MFIQSATNVSIILSYLVRFEFNKKNEMILFLFLGRKLYEIF